MSILLLALMALNWSLETLKWQFLIQRIEPVGFGRALIAVLTGLTVSIFTPNRVGEYLGRAFILRQGSPVKAILLTIVGSMSQLLVTIIAGSVALGVFLYNYVPFNGMWTTGWYFTVITGLVLACLALVLFYFNVPLFGSLSGWLERKSWTKIAGYLRVLNNFKRPELLHVLAISALRYIVFATQFYLVLKLFSVPLLIPAAFITIPLIYLALAAIPTVALSELGVRGSVAVFTIGAILSGNAFVASVHPNLALAIVSATTVLWLINLALPALVGAFFVFKLKFVRQ